MRSYQHHIEAIFKTVNLDAFIELSWETSVPIGTGEHFYGRWEVQKFLRDAGIRVVQADPEWCGGPNPRTTGTRPVGAKSYAGKHRLPPGEPAGSQRNFNLSLQ